MKSYKLTLTLQSAFATPLKGDTLFGQLCWAIRNRLGEDTLTDCLAGYTNNQPFAVVSDAFPGGYYPLPKLPGCFYQLPEDEDRKVIKKRAWLPEAALQQPIKQWLNLAVSAKAFVSNSKHANQLSEKHPQAHNAINRQTNTTGEGGFAPYSVEQEWFVQDLRWSIYVILDTERLSVEDCRQCLEDIGLFGFGKDASIGLGKFIIDDFQEYALPSQANANACLTALGDMAILLCIRKVSRLKTPFYWHKLLLCLVRRRPNLGLLVKVLVVTVSYLKPSRRLFIKAMRRCWQSTLMRV